MSASESICAPNGLDTPSLRASAPSRPSNATQATRQPAASAHVAAHRQEDRQQAEAQAGQRAGVDQRETHPPPHGVRAREQGVGQDSAAGATGRRLHIGEGPAAADVRAGVDHLGLGRGGRAPGVTGTAAHPHQQGLPRGCPAAAEPACPTTPGGTGTIRRTTPAPRGSRHVLPPGIGLPRPLHAAGWCHGPFALTGPKFGGLHHCTAEQLWRAAVRPSCATTPSASFHPPGGRDGPLSGCPCEESN